MSKSVKNIEKKEYFKDASSRYSKINFEIFKDDMFKTRFNIYGISFFK